MSIEGWAGPGSGTTSKCRRLQIAILVDGLLRSASQRNVAARYLSVPLVRTAREALLLSASGRMGCQSGGGLQGTGCDGTEEPEPSKGEFGAPTSHSNSDKDDASNNRGG